MIITKEKLINFQFDEKEGILIINWDTGGHENAICGLKLKVELINKIISNYKAPKINYNSDYKESF